MSQKPRKSKKVVVHSYELTAVMSSDVGSWFVVFTWFQDDQAMITVQAVSNLMGDAVQTAHRAMREAQDELKVGNLVLPDMGDYQVIYHPPWGGGGT
jgi:hypothetical protein